MIWVGWDELEYSQLLPIPPLLAGTAREKKVVYCCLVSAPFILLCWSFCQRRAPALAGIQAREELLKTK